MIRTQDLTKHFGNFTAVENLNLEIGEGEIFGFLGPNGAGKTTTIRMLCGLVGPSSGQGWVAGYRLGTEEQNEKIRAKVGLLTETPGLYELLNAWDNLIFYARLYKIPEVDAKRRVEETLKWLGLWERRSEPVGGFSKGMKQKLAIGRTLLHKPPVLFFDEPTASLDAEASHAVREAITSLKAANRTIFLSTHNLEEAEKLCDRVAIFKQKLLVVETPRQLRRKFGTAMRRVNIKLLPPLPENLLERLVSLPFISGAEMLDGGETGFQLAVNDPDQNNPILIKKLIEAGAEVRYVEEITASLEEIYLKLTH